MFVRKLKSVLPAIAVAVGLTLSGASLAAGPNDTLDKGPKVGATIPHMLKTVDHQNQHQDFKALARKKGLIVLFSRSVGW
jgi:hypothetical protein